MQYDLALKVSGTLNHMSFGVANIQNVRDTAAADAAKLPQSNPLRAQLESLSTKADELRSKIVATKEGGMITGEERIREHVGELYGDINQYEGRPTDYQAARADSLAHELQDVIDDFNKLAAAQLPAINDGLKKQHMAPITLLNEAEWLKEHSTSQGSGSKSATSQMREID